MNKSVNVTDTLLSVGSEAYSLSQSMLLISGQNDFIEKTYGNSIWSVEVDSKTFSDHLKTKLRSHIGLVYTGALYAASQGVKLSADDQKLVSSASVYFYRNADKKVLDELHLDTDDIEKVFSAYRLADISFNRIVEAADIEVSEDEARVLTVAQIKINLEGLTGDELTQKKERARQAMDEILAGGDFFLIASKYDEGGVIQRTVSRDDLSSDIEKTVFALATGDVSEAVTFDNSIYIFKCLDSYEKALSASRREQLLASKKSDYYCLQVRSFVEDHPIYWYEDVWNSFNLENLSVDFGISFYDIYDMFFPGD